MAAASANIMSDIAPSAVADCGNSASDGVSVAVIFAVDFLAKIKSFSMLPRTVRLASAWMPLLMAAAVKL